MLFLVVGQYNDMSCRKLARHAAIVNLPTLSERIQQPGVHAVGLTAGGLNDRTVNFPCIAKNPARGSIPVSVVSSPSSTRGTNSSINDRFWPVSRDCVPAFPDGWIDGNTYREISLRVAIKSAIVSAVASSKHLAEDRISTANKRLEGVRRLHPIRIGRRQALAKFPILGGFQVEWKQGKKTRVASGTMGWHKYTTRGRRPLQGYEAHVDDGCPGSAPAELVSDSARRWVPTRKRGYPSWRRVNRRVSPLCLFSCRFEPRPATPRRPARPNRPGCLSAGRETRGGCRNRRSARKDRAPRGRPHSAGW